MFFDRFKEIRKTASTTEDVLKYLFNDFSISVRDLIDGLRRLTFKENFVSFEATVTIPASSELAIANKIKGIPSKRIIVRSTSPDICDGDTTWNADFVYLKNTSGSPATVTVVFLL